MLPTVILKQELFLGDVFFYLCSNHTPFVRGETSLFGCRRGAQLVDQRELRLTTYAGRHSLWVEGEQTVLHESREHAYELLFLKGVWRPYVGVR